MQDLTRTLLIAALRTSAKTLQEDTGSMSFPGWNHVDEAAQSKEEQQLRKNIRDAARAILCHEDFDFSMQASHKAVGDLIHYIADLQESYI